MLRLTRLELDRARRESKQIVVEGPRCLGQTAGILRQVGQIAARAGWLLEDVDLSNSRTPKDLCNLIGKHLASQLSPTRPHEFQQALDSDYGSRRGSNRVLLLTNVHRLDAEARAWLLGAFSWGGFRPAAVRTIVVAEGAVEIGRALEDELGGGGSFPPRLISIDEVQPWLRLGSTYRLVRNFGVSAPPALIHWLVDLAGGDTGFLHDFLSELPKDEEIDDEGLAVSVDRALQFGSRAAEVRPILATSAAWPPLALLARGSVLRSESPSRCEDPVLRSLYWSGLLDYSRVWRGYRARGTVAARLMAETVVLTNGGKPLDEPLSRARHLMRTVGAVEVCLRACIGAHPQVAQGMDTVSAVGFPVAKRKALLDMLAKGGVESKALGVVAMAVDHVLPSQPKLSEVAAVRDAIEDDVFRLSALTLNELVELARHLGILKGLDPAVGARLAGGRNDIAHFRPLPYSQLRRVDSDVKAVVQALTEAHHANADLVGEDPPVLAEDGD